MTTFFCDRDCKGDWQRKQREGLGFTREWLHHQYVELRKDANAIAKEIGRDGKRVWEWLRDYGIETRKRGTTGNHMHAIGVPRELTAEGRAALSEKSRAARLKDGRMPWLKDGKHWLHHPGKHPATWKGGISPERQAFYATQEWKDAVKTIWKRDNFACRRCAIDLRKKRGENAIHHIDSFANKEKRAEPDNLVLLCKACHLWVHSRKNTKKEYLK